MYLKLKIGLPFPWAYVSTEKSGRHHFWLFFGPVTNPDTRFYGLGLALGPVYVLVGLQLEKAPCTD